LPAGKAGFGFLAIRFIKRTARSTTHLKKPALKSKPGGLTRTGRGTGKSQASRVWLTYPPKLITTPVIWQLGKKFKLVTNVRQASVTDEIGIVSLELEGERSEIKGAIKWLEAQGIKVEPIEINVIES
jgi:L-aspartate semialdehyde sulfurtransferase ferredoxin